MINEKRIFKLFFQAFFLKIYLITLLLFPLFSRFSINFLLKFFLFKEISFFFRFVKKILKKRFSKYLYRIKKWLHNDNGCNPTNNTNTSIAWLLIMSAIISAIKCYHFIVIVIIIIFIIIITVLNLFFLKNLAKFRNFLIF